MVHVKHLLQTLEVLPPELQQEVLDFAEFLAQRQQAKAKSPEGGVFQARQASFGRFKDVFVVPDDFDEPLDDFKGYM